MKRNKISIINNRDILASGSDIESFALALLYIWGIIQKKKRWIEKFREKKLATLWVDGKVHSMNDSVIHLLRNSKQIELNKYFDNLETSVTIQQFFLYNH